MTEKAVKQWKNNEPNFQMMIFENAGHCVNMDIPQTFNIIMEKFWQNESIE